MISHLCPSDTFPLPGLSAGVVVDGPYIFISGQVAFDASGSIVGKDDFPAQVGQVMSNLEAVLRDGGAGFRDVVKVNVFLADRKYLASWRELRWPLLLGSVSSLYAGDRGTDFSRSPDRGRSGCRRSEGQAVNNADICFTPAHRLAELVRRKALSPVEIVDAVLDRVSALEPQVNAFATVAADQARQSAREAESAVQRGDALGPLHGVPRHHQGPRGHPEHSHTARFLCF